MKRRDPVQRLRSSLVTAAVAVALELALRHVFAARDTVAVLLAGGGSAPRLDVALAIGFVLLRMFVHLVLPGLVAREAVLALLTQRGRPEAAAG